MPGIRRVAMLVSAAVVSAAVSFGVARPVYADEGVELRYARSVDSGVTWSDPVAVAAGEPDFPRLAAGGDRAYVAWSEEREDESGDVVLRASGPGGGEFGDAVGVSNSPGKSSESDLAVDGDRVYFVWEDSMAIGAEADEILFARSTDAGATFGQPVNVSGTSERHDTDPILVAAGDLLVVAYETEVTQDNAEVLVQRSTDGGSTWSEAQNLSDDPDDSGEPTMAVAGEIVHVVYEDRGQPIPGADDRLAYARSTDGGATFSPAVILADGAERRGAVAAVGDAVHVVGCSRSDATNSRLFHYRSADGGATWAAPVPLTEAGGECHKPSIDAVGDAVVVAWEQTPAGGEGDVHVLASTDGGATFQPVGNVSRSTGEAEEPTVAMDPATGHVHLVWLDEPGESGTQQPVAAAVHQPAADMPRFSVNVYAAGSRSADRTYRPFPTVAGFRWA